MKNTNRFILWGLIIFTPLLLSSMSNINLTESLKKSNNNKNILTSIYFKNVYGSLEKKRFKIPLVNKTIDIPLSRYDDFKFFSEDISAVKVQLGGETGDFVMNAQYLSRGPLGSCIIRNFTAPNINVPIRYNDDGNNIWIQVGGRYLENVISGCEVTTSWNAHTQLGGNNITRACLIEPLTGTMTPTPGFYSFPISTGETGMWVSNITTSMKLKNNVYIDVPSNIARVPAKGSTNIATGNTSVKNHDFQ